MHSYFKHLEVPQVEEGFDAIITKYFKPEIPEQQEAADLLKSYLR